jgi:FkbM family methyltransferase
MFSFPFLYYTLLSLFKYPTAYRHLLKGRIEVAKAIEQRRLRAWRQRKRAKTRVWGYDVFLDVTRPSYVSASIGTMGVWEPMVTALFQHLVKQNHTIIDVGANIGYFSLLSSRLVGPQGRVLAFEPEAHNFSLLQQTITHNAISNILPYPVALSNYNGVGTLYIGAYSGNHSMLNKTQRPIQIRCRTLDNVVSERAINEVDVLKIDVEGVEPQVLEGATTMLEAHAIHHIIMEYNPSAWVTKDGLLKVLDEAYDVYQLVYSPLILQRITYQTLRNATQHCDVFLKKKLPRN